MASGHVIFHIDMNSFFASCEVAENPELKGSCVIIARESLDQKGIVLAATYEAKSFGVKTTMPLYEAKRLCPNAIIIEPHMEIYSEYSRRFFDYFLKVTPLVEPASIDEGYLDVTDCCSNNEYLELAHKIQDDILSLFGLPCSIGIAPNKFLAKMASDMKKPLGITILRKRDVEKLLWPLEIEDMYGAGKKTCEVLHSLNISKIGDILKFKDLGLLNQLLGENTTKELLNHALGNGDNIVDPTKASSISSVSNSSTFDHDEYDLNKISMLMKVLSNSVSMRLESYGLRGTTFSLQLRYNNFKTYSKSITISQPTNNSYKMYQIFKELFDDIYNVDLAVRLVGVAASKLVKVQEESKQLSIFDSLEKEDQDFEVSKLINCINNELGSTILKKGIKETPKDRLHVDKFMK